MGVVNVVPTDAVSFKFTVAEMVRVACAASVEPSGSTIGFGFFFVFTSPLPPAFPSCVEDTLTDAVGRLVSPFKFQIMLRVFAPSASPGNVMVTLVFGPDDAPGLPDASKKIVPVLPVRHPVSSPARRFTEKSHASRRGTGVFLKSIVAR